MNRHRILLLFAAGLTLAAQQTSQWVYFGPGHKLQYRADERGNRIMDFSYAGYRGGGVALPAVRVAKTVKPIAGGWGRGQWRISGTNKQFAIGNWPPARFTGRCAGS